MAVFIDFDNIEIGVKNTLNTQFDIGVVLEALRERGDVVSKIDILDHVWDEAFDGDPNIVEVYVAHLRNKLDRPFGRSTIETVRGAGYRLAADGG